GGLIIGVGEKLGEVYWGPLVGGAIENWFAYVLALASCSPGRRDCSARRSSSAYDRPPSTQPSRFAPRGRPGGGAPGDHASRNLRRRCSMLGDARNPENTGCRPHPADPVGRVGGGGARGVPVRPGPGGASMVIRT